MFGISFSLSNDYKGFNLYNDSLDISNNFEDIWSKENESLDNRYNLSIYEDAKNNYTNINNNLDNRITNISTFLFLKKNNNNFNNIKNLIFENGESIFNSNKNLKEDNQIKYPLFSIKKIKQHSKYSDDNIMIKIRTFLGNNIHKFLNEILEKDKLKLLKLEPKLFHES